MDIQWQGIDWARTAAFDQELVDAWFALHRTKDPMHPRDPNDIQPGWSYAIFSHWKESKSRLTEIQRFRGEGPKEVGQAVDYLRTLADAQVSLAMEADRVRDLAMRQTSKNRFYGSDGDQSLELVIVPVHENDVELMWVWLDEDSNPVHP